jgi:hypothetical protein
VLARPIGTTRFAAEHPLARGRAARWHDAERALVTD